MRDQQNSTLELTSLLVQTLHPALLDTELEFVEGLIMRLQSNRAISQGHVDDLRGVVERIRQVSGVSIAEPTTDPVTELVDEMKGVQENVGAPVSLLQANTIYPVCVDCGCAMLPTGSWGGTLSWLCSHPDCFARIG